MKKKLIMLLSFVFMACVFAFIATYKTNAQSFTLTAAEKNIASSDFIGGNSTDGCPNEKYECVEVPTASIENTISTSTLTADAEELPTEYCLRDDYIIYTQNQDVHGFCWNFASSMALTTTIMKATNEYYDFSEAYVGLMNTEIDNGYVYGDGGLLSTFHKVFNQYGLILESDMTYDQASLICNENAEQYINYYSEYDKYLNKYNLDYFSLYPNSKDFDRNNIKSHIYEYGGVKISYYSGAYYVRKNVEDYAYLKPFNPNKTSSHAVTIIGWDDNIKITTKGADGSASAEHTGAWICLNSWGDDWAPDGIFYLLYDDTVINSYSGYTFNKDYNGNYFYTTITSGYDYSTSLKGAYCGDLTGENNLTKQKNIYFDNNINLTYSYEIPETGDVKSIEIIHNGTDVTSQFSITIDTENNSFKIFGTASDVGTYKLLVNYFINDNEYTNLNNFYVMNGYETSKINLSVDKTGFQNKHYVDYQSYASDNDDTYVVYTNSLNTSFFINTCWTVYSNHLNELNPMIYNRQCSYPIKFTESDFKNNICIKTLSLGARVLTFKIIYEPEDKKIVNIEYNLNGGTNHENNLSAIVLEKGNSFLIDEPTKAGYNFAGWHIYNSKYDLYKLNRLNSQYILPWEKIYTMPDEPTLYATSTYNNYYKNTNYVLLTALWTKEEIFNIILEYEDMYIESVYLSTNSKAISGDASGTSYQYGTRVYYFIQVIKGDEQYYYTIDGAELISDGIYLIGAITITKDTIIKLPAVIRKEQTYTIEYSCGEGVQIEIWGVTENGWGSSNTFIYGTEATIQISLIGNEKYIYLPNFKYDRVTSISYYQSPNGDMIYYAGYVIYYIVGTDNKLGDFTATKVEHSFILNANLGIGVENLYTTSIKKPETLSDLNSYDYTYKCNDTVYIFLDILEDTDEFDYEPLLTYADFLVEPEKLDSIGMYLIGAVQFKNSNIDLGTISAQQTRKKYLVDYDKNENALEVYMSKDYNGQTKDAPNKEYEYGTELFCFVTIPESTPQYTYSFNGINIKDNLYLVKKFTVLANNNLGLIEVVKTINKFNATFNANGGTLISGNLSQTINYGANASGPLLTREGYTQDGWDKPLTNITADTTITAKWKPITYAITYNLMGGTNHLSNPTNYTIESDTIVLQNPTYEGYNFDGWYYNSNHTGDKVYTINQGSIGDLNLFAKFVAIECSVVFDLDSCRFGNISCIDGNLDNLEYGDSLTFEVTPDTGYEVDKVFVNDVESTVTDNKFTVSNIQENTNIRVTYKESSSIVTPPNEDSSDVPNDTSGLDDNTKYIIYAGIGLIVLLLTVLIIITSKNNKNKKKILAMNDNKASQYNSQSTYNYSQPENIYAQPQRQNQTYNLQKSQQVFNNKSNINQQPNPMLQKALDFVKGKDQHFVSFCNRYNIDYQNNYNNAVLIYYQAYLRSIKPK